MFDINILMLVILISLGSFILLLNLIEFFYYKSQYKNIKYSKEKSKEKIKIKEKTKIKKVEESIDFLDFNFDLNESNLQDIDLDKLNKNEDWANLLEEL